MWSLQYSAVLFVRIYVIKLILALFTTVMFLTEPALAGDDKDKKSAEQPSAKEEKKDSGIVEKAVKMMAIDAVGHDGIIEKGAKAKVLTK